MICYPTFQFDTPVWNYELEESDRDWIIDMLQNQEPEMYEAQQGKTSLIIINPMTEEDDEITIYVEDWI